MGLTSTTRTMLRNNGSTMCTATSKFGGKKKWNGEDCKYLKYIYNSYNLNTENYNIDVKYSKTLRNLDTIYADLNIPFPDNTFLKKYMKKRSTILHIKSKNLYYIHIGGTYIFIKIPPVSSEYLKHGTNALNRAGGQRRAVYNTAKGTMRFATSTVNP